MHAALGILYKRTFAPQKFPNSIFFSPMSDTITISAADVNKLRQQTGAGMMDCRKALQESGGDFKKPSITCAPKARR